VDGKVQWSDRCKHVSVVLLIGLAKWIDAMPRCSKRRRRGGCWRTER